MGNSNSFHHQHCQVASPPQDMGRGWTQSFPRELSRHHSQPPGHKVLPEPPNQRLRATNNGNIIHNGGTISGRRPSTMTLPHESNKGVYRSRSTSVSNIGESRGRPDQKKQHCCSGHFRPCDGSCRENEMTEIKRFDSEPDLRYPPEDASKRHAEARQCNNYPERESRERESRYRNKKKYKAPAPPMNGDGSSPDSYKWEINGQDQHDCCKDDGSRMQPPPRRSRLFKTRAETKRQQSNNWTQAAECVEEGDRRWRAGGKENRPWKDPRDTRTPVKPLDGKNTLQRSLSSPEFQAELMQVARKVRNKLNFNRRVGPVGATHEQRSEISKSTTFLDGSRDNQSDRKARGSRIELPQAREEFRPRKSRSSGDGMFEKKCEEIRSSARFFEEKKFHERGEKRVIRSQEVRSYEERKSVDNPRVDERLENVSRRRVLEKSSTYEENVVSNGNGECISTRKLMNNRLESLEHSQDDRNSEGRLMRKDFDRRNERSKTSEPFAKARKSADVTNLARTRSQSPATKQGSRMDVRGQGSGRESTPEPPRGREKKVADNRRRRHEVKDENFSEKRRFDDAPAKGEKIHKAYEKNIVKESKDVDKNWNLINGAPLKSTQTKTFYFGAEDNSTRDNNTSQNNRLQMRLQDYSKQQNLQNDLDEGKNQNEDIALKLRPTLPKKQLEIPRFSPSAAWRLLSALETTGPTMSTASEEVPVMYEERIERLSRPPPPLVAVGPRSFHDKSGDSGVSCDAGAPNDDPLEVGGRLKTQTTRPAWTPQEDLGEESSSDAGVDSPPPMAPEVKFPPRAHVFSLSLPRDDGRHPVYSADKPKDTSSFNSLQKIKRSVSGAFGLTCEFDKKHSGLDDNWLLSTSAPTSLQHSQNQAREGRVNSSTTWDVSHPGEEIEERIFEASESKTEFLRVMKPPSFSYLASGGHIMYLPASNHTEQRTQSLNYRNAAGETDVKGSNINSRNVKTMEQSKGIKNSFINGFNRNNGEKMEMNLFRERSFTDLGNKNRKYSNFSKSCENISEMRQKNCSPGPENLQDKDNHVENIKNPVKSNSKTKRFTFQSTVRQIERRRLAEKLSREAEAKERQRKSEVEAMRKVEEEFQRKRAKEKANIRQQLRLYNMDENSSSLPPASDSSNLSRADPDGAPSSSASSPTSAPPGKLANNRKGSVSSDEYHRKKECRVQQQKQEPREYKDYRPKYYDWPPNNESSSHLEIKQTTVHPKIVCDIPKSTHFVDGNLHPNKPGNLNSTPRSDNYRKDFAHGAIAARSSLASSDSELSQPNTRPHSRQNGNKNSKPVRTREETSPKAERKATLTRPASPRSSEVTSSEEEAPVEAIRRDRASVNVTNGFILNTLQPFVREKSYRPITFNPQPPPIPS